MMSLPALQRHFAGDATSVLNNKKRRRKCKSNIIYPSAKEAFGDTRRALKIQPQWLHKILTGVKTIEIRSGPCPHIGRVSLQETGSKLIKGRATLTYSRLMTDDEKTQHAEAIEFLSNYKQHWAWLLSDVTRLPKPFPVPLDVTRSTITWTTREKWEAWEKNISILNAADVTSARSSKRNRKKNAKRKVTGSSTVSVSSSALCVEPAIVPVAPTFALSVDPRGYMLFRHNRCSVTRRRGDNCVVDALSQALGDSSIVTKHKLLEFAKLHRSETSNVCRLGFVAAFLTATRSPWELRRDKSLKNLGNIFQATPAIRLVTYQVRCTDANQKYHCIVLDGFRRLIVDNSSDTVRRYYHWDETLLSDRDKACSFLSDRYGWIALHEAYIVKVNVKRVHETCHDAASKLN